MVWILDLDGVIWLADQPIAGAADAVGELRAAGHEVVFVTNNSSLPVAEMEAKLGRFDIDASGAVVTSAMVAAQCVTPGETALLCGAAGVREALENRGANIVTDGFADVVVVVGRPRPSRSTISA